MMLRITSHDYHHSSESVVPVCDLRVSTYCSHWCASPVTSPRRYSSLVLSHRYSSLVSTFVVSPGAVQVACQWFAIQAWFRVTVALPARGRAQPHWQPLQVESDSDRLGDCDERSGSRLRSMQPESLEPPPSLKHAAHQRQARAYQ
jgi:hypothetical protein